MSFKENGECEKMNILFVCTGNTCRSPMAEAICRVKYPNRHAGSAGLVAHIPLPATDDAVEAVALYGGDLSEHLSRQVSAEMLEEAEIVVPMAQAHAERLRELFPQFSHKLRLLGEVADPFGGDAEDYRLCAELISELLDSL